MPERDTDIPEEHRGDQRFVILRSDEPGGHNLWVLSGAIGECADAQTAAKRISVVARKKVVVALEITGLSMHALQKLENYMPRVTSVRDLTRHRFLQQLLSDRQ